MNQEVLEYRLKANKAMTVLIGAVVITMIGFAVWAITFPLTGTAGLVGTMVAVLCIIGASYLTFLVAAVSDDGYARAIVSKVKTLNDPPIYEWREELKEKDAFAVEVKE